MSAISLTQLEKSQKHQNSSVRGYFWVFYKEWFLVLIYFGGKMFNFERYV